MSGKASGRTNGGTQILMKKLTIMSQAPDSTSDSAPASVVELDPQTRPPKMYKVLLLNDDFTPMDFVVYVLRRFFNKTETAAEQIMMDVHKKGSGIAGVYSLEIAEMKVMQVNHYARSQQHPLRCEMEAE
jgi:ATP-dependent Clp protease adaptor protein ClpS